MSGSFATMAMENERVNERPWLNISAERQGMDRETYLQVRSMISKEDLVVWQIQEDEDKIQWLRDNPLNMGEKAREYRATQDFLRNNPVGQVDPVDQELEDRVVRIERDEPWLVQLAENKGYDVRTALTIRDLLSEEERKDLLEEERQAEAQWKLAHSVKM